MALLEVDDKDDPQRSEMSNQELAFRLGTVAAHPQTQELRDALKVSANRAIVQTPGFLVFRSRHWKTQPSSPQRGKQDLSETVRHRHFVLSPAFYSSKK